MATPNVGRALVSAVLLAAGRSTRLGPGLAKQLVEVNGEPLVRRSARVLLAAGLDEVVVVVGHRASGVRSALEGLAVAIVHNPSFADGLSTSVRAGLAAIDPAADGATFVPCDQPYLDVETLKRLLEAFRTGRKPIVVPVHGGVRGGPVFFSSSLFAEMSEIRGDVGGRGLLRRDPSRVLEVELHSMRPMLDLDSPADLEELRRLDR